MFHKGFASPRGIAALSLMLGLLSLMASSATAITFNDSGFVPETVTTLPRYTPVGLTFAPDGRMFIWQKPEGRDRSGWKYRLMCRER